MARTASMSIADAELLIGPADELTEVNSVNRPVLRKWMTARGFPSNVGYTMSNVELLNEYAMHAHYRTRDDRPVASDTSGAALQFAEALRAIMGNPTARLDETRVQQMIDAAIANVKPQEVVTRLEISSPAGIQNIEGIIHGSTSLVIRIANIGHNVMLVGPAGAAKTSICAHVATALALPLYITSTVFDTHELLGFTDGHGNYHSTAFRQAFEHGGVWVADEVDAWDAAALLAANSALANGYATFPDTPVPVRRHANFRVIATANTYGHGADRVYVGRNELDAASLDRFAMIAIDYDHDLEVALSGGNAAWLDRVIEVRNVVRAKNIRAVVSTRAIIMGSQALAAGIEWNDVENIYLFKGMSAADRAKI